jgi:hypothetical protein
MQTHDSGNALEIIISYSMNSIYFIRTIESIAINGSFNLMQWRINYFSIFSVCWWIWSLISKFSGTPINEYRSTLKTRRWLSLRDDPIMRMHAVLKWISSWRFFSLVDVRTPSKQILFNHRKKFEQLLVDAARCKKMMLFWFIWFHFYVEISIL